MIENKEANFLQKKAEEVGGKKNRELKESKLSRYEA